MASIIEYAVNVATAKAEKGIEALGKKAENTDKAMSGMAKAAIGVGLAVSALAVQQISEGVVSAIAYEKSLFNLTQTAKGLNLPIGDITKAIDSMNNSISALSKDGITKSMTNLLNIGYGIEEAKRVIVGATNVALTKGFEGATLNEKIIEYTKQLKEGSKAAGEQIGSQAEVIVKLNGQIDRKKTLLALEKESLKNANATDEYNNSTVGKLDLMNKRWDETKTKLGSGILPLITALGDGLTYLIDKTGQFGTKLGEAISNAVDDSDGNVIKFYDKFYKQLRLKDKIDFSKPDAIKQFANKIASNSAVSENMEDAMYSLSSDKSKQKFLETMTKASNDVNSVIKDVKTAQDRAVKNIPNMSFGEKLLSPFDFSAHQDLIDDLKEQDKQIKEFLSSEVVREFKKTQMQTKIADEKLKNIKDDELSQAEIDAAKKKSDEDRKKAKEDEIKRIDEQIDINNEAGKITNMLYKAEIDRVNDEFQKSYEIATKEIEKSNLQDEKAKEIDKAQTRELQMLKAETEFAKAMLEESYNLQDELDKLQTAYEEGEITKEVLDKSIGRVKAISVVSVVRVEQLKSKTKDGKTSDKVDEAAKRELDTKKQAQDSFVSFVDQSLNTIILSNMNAADKLTAIWENVYTSIAQQAITNLSKSIFDSSLSLLSSLVPGGGLISGFLSLFEGFATGGIITGPGTGTSDSIPIRVSKGESIMNAKTTSMFTKELSYMNVLGGGKPFDNSYGKSNYATGGIINSNSNNDALIKEMKMVRVAIANIKPVRLESVSDIGIYKASQSGQKRNNNI